MSEAQSLNVWTLSKGAKPRWKLQLTTTDIEEALASFIAFSDAGRQVAVYELGEFEHEGEQVVGQVGFMWSENLNDYMGSEPSGRGQGWTEDYNTFVAYAALSAQSRSLTTTSSTRQLSQPRYVEAACERCGVILPMNELQHYTHDVQTGRVSGTTRTSHSTTSRMSSRSFSSSTRNATSHTSGRRYYRSETLLLCPGCYEQHRLADRNIFQILWDGLTK